MIGYSFVFASNEPEQAKHEARSPRATASSATTSS